MIEEKRVFVSAVPSKAGNNATQELRTIMCSHCAQGISSISSLFADRSLLGIFQDKGRLHTYVKLHWLACNTCPATVQMQREVGSHKCCIISCASNTAEQHSYSLLSFLCSTAFTTDSYILSSFSCLVRLYTYQYKVLMVQSSKLGYDCFNSNVLT